MGSALRMPCVLALSLTARRPSGVFGPRLVRLAPFLELIICLLQVLTRGRGREFSGTRVCSGEETRRVRPSVACLHLARLWSKEHPSRLRHLRHLQRFYKLQFHYAAG